MAGQTSRSWQTTIRGGLSIASLCLFTLFSAEVASQESDIIDLNKANVEALDTLPGIGPKKAAAIIEFRTTKGKFGHPLDIVQVSGIGTSTYQKLCRRIKVGKLVGCNDKGEAPTLPMEIVDASGDTRLNINSASAKELQMLPGVGAKRAAVIIESRKTDGAFVETSDLKRIRGIGDKTFAKMEPFVRTTFDPNTATDVELDAVGVLSARQVSALLKHRGNKARTFKKTEDLKKVPGLDAATVDKLRPFIAFWE